MPYYRITIQLLKKKKVIGIRQLNNADIEYAWKYFEKKILQEYRGTEIISYEIVMLSKLSKDVKQFLAKAKRPLINE